MGPLLIGDRPLPHSVDMEGAVLSCILQSPIECFEEAGNLKASDFYVPSNRRIFESIAEIKRNNGKIDVMTVTNALFSAGVLDDVGGLDNLRRITNLVPSWANFRDYLHTVLTHGRSRKLIETCSATIGNIMETDANFNEVIGSASKDINELIEESGNLGGVTYLSDVLGDSSAAIMGRFRKEPQYMGMSTGFQEVNRIIEGLKAGDGGYFILGARPSIGKTTWALNLAENLCRYGFEGVQTPGCFISMETGGATVGQKMIYQTSGISHNDIVHANIGAPELISKISHARDALAIPIIIDDQMGCFEEVYNRIETYIRKYGCKFCIIDYIQLLRLRKPFNNREQDVAYMSDKLKKLGAKLGCAMVVLAQLNRGAEGKKPALSDFRESGALEQDADIIGLIHRPRDTDGDGQSIRSPNGSIATDIIFPKNRNGATGVAHLEFFPEYSRFGDRPRYTDEYVQQ